MEKTRIFLWDGHPVVLQGIRYTLSEHVELEVVGETSRDGSALKLIHSSQPDIVVADVCIHHAEGTEIVRQMRKLHPDIRIIVFSAHWDPACVMDMINVLNISGYILKEDPVSELLLAIKVARSGKKYFSKAIEQFLSNTRGEFVKRERQCLGFKGLTSRECEVLRFLAEGDTVREIAKKLCLSPKTVESHKYKMMSKLGLATLAGLTRYAVRINIVDL